MVAGGDQEGVFMSEPIIITRTHKCLPFIDLCTEDKKRVMQNYSEWSIDGFDWWEDVYDSFVTELKVWGMTIRPKDINFMGFYSQGDAAAFSAYEIDMPLLLRALGEKVPAIAGATTRLQDALARDIISLRCEIKDYGQHYCSQGACLEIDWFADEMSDAERAVLEVLCSHVEAELQDVCRAAARTLFENLRTEYEYLTSEEYLMENWDANGAVFEIGTGKIFYRED